MIPRKGEAQRRAPPFGYRCRIVEAHRPGEALPLAFAATLEANVEGLFKGVEEAPSPPEFLVGKNADDGRPPTVKYPHPPLPQRGRELFAKGGGNL